MNSSGAKQVLQMAAMRLGFQACRVARADFLAEEAPSLDAWLAKGYHGSMAYMENHYEKRLDPRKLVPGAKSVISLAYNYFPEKDLADGEKPRIAKYAYGEDYHRVVKDKLFELLDSLRESLGAMEGRCFVDSAPVMERAWAQRSGLGWVGKNSLLLRKNEGSFFFLAELIVDYDFTPDTPVADHCGTCTRCLDACPTGAIISPEVVDSSRCISHMTIELHGALPESHKAAISPWVFGCDICQDVCPWNRHAKSHTEPCFTPNEWPDWTAEDWTEMTEETFGRVFGKSALTRRGLEGIRRNLGAGRLES